MIQYILIGIVIGVVLTTGVGLAWFYEKFSDYGGTILIDNEERVVRFYLNDDMEDWNKQKFIIFKTAQSEVPLKRLNKINSMDIEDEQ